MKYTIVELEEFCGTKSTVYSVLKDNDENTSFDNFVNESISNHKKEIKFIVSRLQEIGQSTGAREIFFKLHEGKPGDGVSALYDDILRLYCIRYGSIAIIVGGGGPKAPSIDSWQMDDKLTKEVEEMIKVSSDVSKRMQDREIYWSPDGLNLMGNLTFTDDE